MKTSVYLDPDDKRRLTALARSSCVSEAELETTLLDAMDVRRATLADIDCIATMRDAAARWQQARHIAQWVPGEISHDEFRRQTEDGELYVVRVGHVLAGSVRLLWSDDEVWGPDAAGRAGYVHGLMVADRGSGLGRQLLGWAEGRVVEAGRSVVRLDCVLGNDRLRRYYRSAGYAEVGSFRYPNPHWGPVMRFEKRVGGPAG